VYIAESAEPIVMIGIQHKMNKRFISTMSHTFIKKIYKKLSSLKKPNIKHHPSINMCRKIKNPARIILTCPPVKIKEITIK
jgi:hypothetical protein